MGKTKKEHQDRQKGMIIVVAVLALLVVAGLSAVMIYRGLEESRPTSTKTQTQDEAEYINKVRFDFGTESYIYYLADGQIKFVERFPEYEVKKDCNCLEPTGKYTEKEHYISFSQSNKNLIISVIKSLAERAGGARDFSTDSLNLSNEENRILLSVALNDENMLNVVDSISYQDKKTDEYPIAGSRFQYLNTLTLLRTDTQNEVINKAAAYVNQIASENYNKYNERAKSLAEHPEGEVNEILGVSVKTEIVWAGPYSISARITASGNLGKGAFTLTQGYVFDYNGQVKEELAGGKRAEYGTGAIAAIEKTDYFQSIKDTVSPNWSENLRGQILQLGHWYLVDEGIVFLFRQTFSE
ncbi:hypothetical protein J5500_03085 [Candidatus Saccharibacteria bacterium]|nr:hypothetical protein [Candidatus Saccharibacteria bacterium]